MGGIIKIRLGVNLNIMHLLNTFLSLSILPILKEYIKILMVVEISNIWMVKILQVLDLIL